MVLTGGLPPFLSAIVFFPNWNSKRAKVAMKEHWQGPSGSYKVFEFGLETGKRYKRHILGGLFIVQREYISVKYGLLCVEGIWRWHWGNNPRWVAVKNPPPYPRWVLVKGSKYIFTSISGENLELLLGLWQVFNVWIMNHRIDRPQSLALLVLTKKLVWLAL